MLNGWKSTHFSHTQFISAQFLFVANWRKEISAPFSHYVRRGRWPALSFAFTGRPHSGLA